MSDSDRAERLEEPTPARAKTLPLRGPEPAEPPALVPARMLNESLYCERLMYIEWVQGEFADNVFTVDGRHVHRRPDNSQGPMPAPARKKSAAGDDEEEDPEPGVEPLPYVAKSVWLSSEKLGITAKIDVVEGDASGVIPIEYKRGKPPDIPERAWTPERAQLCAQVLLLRDHGYTCDHGEIYYAAARQRVTIDITDDLIDLTQRAVQRAREVASSAEMPPPLRDSPKCDGCSLVGICLPDETNLLHGEPAPCEARDGRDEMDEQLDGPLQADPWELAPPVPASQELRRLHPARDDSIPLYVQASGARVGLDGQCLVVRNKDGVLAEAKLPQVSQVCVFGNVQVTTPALRAILERDVPLSFFSYGGWYYGRAVAHSSKNVALRLAQYRATGDEATCLTLARGFVASKIRNTRTMLRRNHATVDATVLHEMEGLARKAEAATALESLLGIEGTAARYYFQNFAGMLKVQPEPGFDVDGRNRRPPRDPINAMLSFGYALLTKELARTLEAVGLDPMLGFYHQPRFGRPALALDMMEEFRPLVVDSTVIAAVNMGVIAPGEFVRAGVGVAMKPTARKRLIEGYERRMDQLVTHPVFGYRISYRRVLEVQARLMGRLLMGEIDRYPSFRTR